MDKLLDEPDQTFFSSIILSNYYSLYKNKKFCDVKICCGIDSTDDSKQKIVEKNEDEKKKTKVFNCHKLILSAQSPYFEAMFYNCPMIETNLDQVELKETDPDVFELLLHIVYGGCLDLMMKPMIHHPEKLVQLYIMAERYQFVNFEKILSNQIRRILSKDNLWQFFDYAAIYQVESLIEICFLFLEKLHPPLAVDSETLPLPTNYCRCRCRCPKPEVNGDEFQHLEQIFSDPYFTHLSHQTLLTLLDRDFTTNELILLKAVIEWIRCNLNSTIEESQISVIMKKIRLNLIPEIGELFRTGNFNFKYLSLDDLQEASSHHSSSYFKSIVDRFLDQSQICKIVLPVVFSSNNNHNSEYQTMFKKATSRIIRRRSIIFPNINLCQEDFGFRVISPYDNKDGNQDFKDKNSSHTQYFKVDLHFPFMINYIELELSDVQGDRFSYLIERSVDGCTWFTVYDYRNFICSNHQKLFMSPVACRYFRVSGVCQKRLDIRTRKVFTDINSLKAFFIFSNIDIDLKLVGGIMLGEYYTSQIGHRVYCYKTFQAHLLNFRYYCHLLPPQQTSISNSDNDSYDMNEPTTTNDNGVHRHRTQILVLTDQPVMLQSFKFHLYDKDDRAYSYTVDIYDHHSNSWDRVADRSKSKWKSWQEITFSLRPVHKILIRGVKIYNSDCNEMRITKFIFR